MITSRLVVAWGWWGERGKDYQGHKGTFRVMDVFTILTVVMVL